MAKRKKRFMTPKAARRRQRKLRSKIAERRKKEFTYRGLTLDQLRSLPLFPPKNNPEAECMAMYLPSRARRSLDRMRQEFYVHMEDEDKRLSEVDWKNLSKDEQEKYEMRSDNAEENTKFIESINNSDGVVRTHRRDMVVLPTFVGRTISIYNGRQFQPIEIKPEMIGHYLGEFAITRRSVTHSGPGVGATRSSKHVPLK